MDLTGINPLVRQFLAIIAVLIIALALSTNKTGATIVQSGIIIAIVVVVLRNQPAITEVLANLTKTATGVQEQQASP